MLVCLRVIIEHHKQFRPSLSPEVRERIPDKGGGGEERD